MRRSTEPCHTCSQRPRMPGKSFCHPCASAYEKERRRDQSDQINARRREIQTPAQRKRHKLAAYNLTPETFGIFLAKQGGGCAICGRVGEMHVDHDHTCCPERFRSCGKCVRGLLCTNCNLGLGHFRDKPELLDRASAYLAGSPMAGAWADAATEPIKPAQLDKPTEAAT